MIVRFSYKSTSSKASKWWKAQEERYNQNVPCTEDNELPQRQAEWGTQKSSPLRQDLMQSQQKQIEQCYADVQWQSGLRDCGLFSLAFATSICFGAHPTTIALEQWLLRSHLLDCIQSEKLSMFPVRTNTRRLKPLKKEHISNYCVCHLNDESAQMIECFSSLKWFHQSGVRMLNKELQWKCLKCKYRQGTQD